MTDEINKLRAKSDRLAAHERRSYARLCSIRDELDETAALIDMLTRRPTLRSGSVLPFHRHRGFQRLNHDHHTLAFKRGVE